MIGAGEGTQTVCGDRAWSHHDAVWWACTLLVGGEERRAVMHLVFHFTTSCTALNSQSSKRDGDARASERIVVPRSKNLGTGQTGTHTTPPCEPL